VTLSWSVPSREAKDGDVVVARTGTDVSVKRYELRNDGAYLVSHRNPMRVDAPGTRIIGKVVGLIRPVC
jgi:SOS-response transcriptional repressor LexA